MARFTHDQNQAPAPREEFALMPEGDYLAIIVDTTVKRNGKDTGDLLELTREILLPAEHKGRKVWQSINVAHANGKAQEIGQRELANVKAAIGFSGVLDDTLRLHGKPHGIKLKIEKGDGNYRDKNVVYDSFAASAAGATPAAAPAAPPAATAQTEPATPPASAPAAPAAANTAPWLKRG